MKKELIKQVSEEFHSQSKELKRLWMEYVKEKGEVKLGGFYITMWDGAGERMGRLTYHDGEVFIVDIFGNEYDFDHEGDCDTEIHYGYHIYSVHYSDDYVNIDITKHEL